MFHFIPLDSFQHLLYNLLTLLLILIFVDLLIANLICFGVKLSRFHHVIRFVRSIVDPLVNPIRRVMPSPRYTGNLDFAPMIAMVIVQIIRNVLI